MTLRGGFRGGAGFGIVLAIAGLLASFTPQAAAAAPDGGRALPGKLGAQVGCPADTARMVVAELFFGRAIDAGAAEREVTEAEWAGFVAHTLIQAFPDGFTVRDAWGAWRDPASGRTVTEATKDVLVALPDRPGWLAPVRHVILVYRLRFHQKSVGLLLTRECGRF